MKTGTQLITEERQRQISQEGWTPEHDDTHADGELAAAAVAYAEYYLTNGHDETPPPMWPFSPECFSPSGDLRMLVKAGALIAAEIDRLQRLTPEPKGDA